MNIKKLNIQKCIDIYGYLRVLRDISFVLLHTNNLEKLIQICS